MAPGWSTKAYTQQNKSVALNLHVSVNDAQVYAGRIQQLLILALRTPQQVEMALKVLT